MTSHRNDRFRRDFARMPNSIKKQARQLFYTKEQRLLMIGMLLENVGVDAVVKLGDPQAWRKAVAALPDSKP